MSTKTPQYEDAQLQKGVGNGLEQLQRSQDLLKILCPDVTTTIESDSLRSLDVFRQVIKVENLGWLEMQNREGLLEDLAVGFE